MGRAHCVNVSPPGVTLLIVIALAATVYLTDHYRAVKRLANGEPDERKVWQIIFWIAAWFAFLIAWAMIDSKGNA